MKRLLVLMLIFSAGMLFGQTKGLMKKTNVQGASAVDQIARDSASVALARTSPQKTLYVSPTYSGLAAPYYETIQEAVSAASSGDVVELFGATYTEDITFGKRIYLHSSQNTRLAGNLFVVEGDTVIISGVEIGGVLQQNGGYVSCAGDVMTAQIIDTSGTMILNFRSIRTIIGTVAGGANLTIRADSFYVSPGTQTGELLRLWGSSRADIVVNHLLQKITAYDTSTIYIHESGGSQHGQLTCADSTSTLIVANCNFLVNVPNVAGLHNIETEDGGIIFLYNSTFKTGSFQHGGFTGSPVSLAGTYSIYAFNCSFIDSGGSAYYQSCVSAGANGRGEWIKCNFEHLGRGSDGGGGAIVGVPALPATVHQRFIDCSFHSAIFEGLLISNGTRSLTTGDSLIISNMTFQSDTIDQRAVNDLVVGETIQDTLYKYMPNTTKQLLGNNVVGDSASFRVVKIGGGASTANYDSIRVRAVNLDKINSTGAGTITLQGVVNIGDYIRGTDGASLQIRPGWGGYSVQFTDYAGSKAIFGISNTGVITLGDSTFLRNHDETMTLIDEYTGNSNWNTLTADSIYARAYGNLPAGGSGTFGGLTDVDTTGKVNGSVIKYNTGSGKWVVGTDNTGGGGFSWSVDGSSTAGDSLRFHNLNMFTWTQTGNAVTASLDTTTAFAKVKSDISGKLGWSDSTTFLAYTKSIANAKLSWSDSTTFLAYSKSLISAKLGWSDTTTFDAYMKSLIALNLPKAHVGDSIDSHITAQSVAPDTSDDFVIDGDILRIRYKVPDTTSHAGDFLKGDLTWGSPTGGGDLSWSDSTTFLAYVKSLLDLKLVWSDSTTFLAYVKANKIAMSDSTTFLAYTKSIANAKLSWSDSTTFLAYVKANKIAMSDSTTFLAYVKASKLGWSDSTALLAYTKSLITGSGTDTIIAVSNGITRGTTGNTVTLGLDTTIVPILEGPSSGWLWQRDASHTRVVVPAVDSSEFSYIDGVTSAIQTQLDGKIAKATVKNLFSYPMVDTCLTTDTLAIYSIGVACTLDSIRYATGRGFVGTFRIDMVDSLTQGAGTLIDTTTCNNVSRRVQYGATLNSTTLTAAKLLRLTWVGVSTPLSRGKSALVSFFTHE